MQKTKKALTWLIEWLEVIGLFLYCATFVVTGSAVMFFVAKTIILFFIRIVEIFA